MNQAKSARGWLMASMALIGLFAVVGTAWCQQPAAKPADPHAERLRRLGIEPTPQGVIEFLKPVDAQRVKALIEQLGDNSFRIRQRATKTLIRTRPIEALRTAAKSRDLEVALRAKRILDATKDYDESTALLAVFQAMRSKRYAAAIPALLERTAGLRDEHLRVAAGEALSAIARKEDASLLRRALGHESAHVRIAATSSLGVVLGKEASDDLAKALTDKDERVRLAAATALANLGDRRCLRVFVELLESKNAQIRIASGLALAGLSGKDFGNVAYAKPEDRRKLIAKWDAWVNGEGKTAKLAFPLKPVGGVLGSHLHGHTLLAFGTKNKVAEYDRTDKEVWTFTVGYARSAEKLPGGNVLIAAYGDGRVVEVDAGGKIVWQVPAHRVENAHALRNGNILVALHGRQLVQEINRDKQVVWEYPTAGPAVDAHRLPNGNTLLVDHKTIREVTPDRRTVWEHTGSVYNIQPLPNGNILVAGFWANRVYELTRDKKIVWEFDEHQAVDAFRLANGNTLITGGRRFIEVTPDKKIVWSKSGCVHGTARR